MSNDPPQSRPPRLVPRSWTTLLFAAAALLLTVGYITFNRIADSLDVPDELIPYQTQSAAASQVRSKGGAIADGVPLALAQVQSYMASLPSVGKPLDRVAGLIDSLANGSDKGRPPSVASVWRNTNALHSVTLLPASARRELAAWLNARNMSWEQYARLKERIVAAAHLTEADVASAFSARLGRYFMAGDTAHLLDTRSCRPLFRRVAGLRPPPQVAAADSTLVAPFRQALLSQGIASMMDIENVFE